MVRRALLFIAFAISLLLAGCRQFEPIRTFDGTKAVLANEPMPWGFSCSFFGDEERQAVRDAFDYWDGMTHKKLFQETQDCGSINPSDGGVLVVRTDHSNAMNTKDFTILAYVERYMSSDGLAGAVMTFEPQWGTFEYADGTFRATPRHEVGHILGFEHFPRKSCLMYKTISAHDDDMPLETGQTKGACAEELAVFHQYYGN